MKMLLVEDDHTITAALRQNLRREKIAVDVLYDSASGRVAAFQNTYDLIIIDGQMEDQANGVALIRDIRAAKNHTPVLMLTDKDNPKERVDGLNAGADDYLVKPFPFEELLTRARTLTQTPTGFDDIFTFEDLSLNSTTYEVLRAGRTIALSRREFALLEFLMRNAGTVLTKDTIIKHVWNFDAGILPNTVEVYIGYLRTKIDRPFKSRKLIRTVRGYGYRLG